MRSDYSEFFYPKPKVGIELKILRGTQRTDKGSLCTTCARSVVIRGAGNQDEDYTFCRAFDPDKRITFTVTQCNEYTDRSLPSLYDMKQIAWELKTDKKRQIGFNPPSRNSNARERAERFEDIDD